MGIIAGALVTVLALLAGGAWFWQQQQTRQARALSRQNRQLAEEKTALADEKTKDLHERLKTTMVYVTHDQVEAMTLAQRKAIARKLNKDTEV